MDINDDRNVVPTNGLPHDAALLAAVLSSDDEGSSGLSEIDVNLDTDQLDDEAMSLALNLHTEHINPSNSAATADNDSEAETERIAPSPGHRSTADDGAGPSVTTTPRKPAQVKLKLDLDHDADREEEEQRDRDVDGGDDADNEADTDAKPSSKKPTQNRRPTEATNGAEGEEDETNTSGTPLTTNSKRKRSGSPEQSDAKPIEDEPLRKRRGSLALRTDKLVAESHLRIPGSPLKISETVPDKTPDNAEEFQDIGVNTRAKRGKRSKRRTRSTRHISDDRRNESPSDEYTSPEQDGENGDGDLHQDSETILKSEEEAIRKKASALDALSNLESQFMLMKDRVYDERIGNYQKEIDQLVNHPEEHAEYQEYISMITAHKTQKEDYERTLLSYRLQSLCVKSEVDRLRIHSSYHQNVRDVRERHLDEISAMHYRLTQDRFQSSEACPDYVIPFPTRRSQQIAQQAAYNKEVSILAGFAKYVGFPAAPEITPAKSHECEEDLEKIGIATSALYGPLPHHVAVSDPPNAHPQRGTFPSAMAQRILPQAHAMSHFQASQQGSQPHVHAHYHHHHHSQQRQQEPHSQIFGLDSYLAKQQHQQRQLTHHHHHHRHPTYHQPFSLNGPEEEFLEHTLWANPQHPVTEKYIQRIQTQNQQNRHLDRLAPAHANGHPLGQPISLPGPQPPLSALLEYSHHHRSPPPQQQHQQQQPIQAPAYPAQGPVNSCTTPAQQRMVDLGAASESASTLPASSTHGSSTRNTHQDAQRSSAQQALPQSSQSHRHTPSQPSNGHHHQQPPHSASGGRFIGMLQGAAALTRKQGPEKGPGAKSQGPSADNLVKVNGERGDSQSPAASPLDVRKSGVYRARLQWPDFLGRPSPVS
ncbi:hypothetical protein KEM56_006511 [Ascosphaera pollenicola]|nr:hypothetical protein KEM56_006511 [Ascosphaera pollenicola]